MGCSVCCRHGPAMHSQLLRPHINSYIHGAGSIKLPTCGCLFPPAHPSNGTVPLTSLWYQQLPTSQLPSMQAWLKPAQCLSLGWGFFSCTPISPETSLGNGPAVPLLHSTALKAGLYCQFTHWKIKACRLCISKHFYMALQKPARSGFSILIKTQHLKTPQHSIKTYVIKIDQTA